MVWKPKERELTKEEAVVQAKKEYAPFWLGMRPLFVAARSAAGQLPQLFPLDDKFKKENWLILFCDPFSFEGNTSLIFFQEWKKRYSDLGIQFIIIFSTTIALEKDAKKAMDTVFLKYYSNIPVVYDFDQSFMELFEVQQGSRFVLFSEGKLFFSRHEKQPLASWYGVIEKEVQAFLRKQDSGLALLPEYRITESVVQSQKVSTLSSALFKSKNGTWKRDGKFIDHPDCVEVHENGSTITFKSKATCLAIVVRVIGKSGMAPRGLVEVDGRSVFDRYGDRDLQFDDSGNSFFQVAQAGLLRLAKELPAQEHEVVLTFPTAGSAPFIIYRILEGSSAG